VSWRIRGSYFESCNCDPICPLDEAVTDEQRAALEAIFTGRLGGDALRHLLILAAWGLAGLVVAVRRFAWTPT
jgi:hypothetical protein